MRKFVAISSSLVAMTLVLGAARTTSAKVTPSDVYASVDLLSRSLDALLEARNVPPPPVPLSLESGLGPTHVYQLHVACVDQLYEFEAKNDIPPIPAVICRPMKYTPTDVRMLTHLMTADVRRLASILNVEGLPKTTEPFSRKTPADVFQATLNVYAKLNALNGVTKITSNEVFSELVRAASDVRSILTRVDVAQRYRIDTPLIEGTKKPTDVMAECLKVRRAINQVRQELNLGTTPLPQIDPARTLHPEDVFLQTQIIIAELNLVKLGTGTSSSTPLAVPVTGKTPADCYQQAADVEYLLKQVRGLRRAVAANQTIK